MSLQHDAPLVGLLPYVVTHSGIDVLSQLVRGHVAHHEEVGRHGVVELAPVLASGHESDNAREHELWGTDGSEAGSGGSCCRQSILHARGDGGRLGSGRGILRGGGDILSSGGGVQDSAGDVLCDILSAARRRQRIHRAPTWLRRDPQPGARPSQCYGHGSRHPRCPPPATPSRLGCVHGVHHRAQNGGRARAGVARHSDRGNCCLGMRPVVRMHVQLRAMGKFGLSAEKILSTVTMLKGLGMLDWPALALLHGDGATAAVIGTTWGDAGKSPDSPSRERASFQGGRSVMGLIRA
jgi:hypothetical protein